MILANDPSMTLPLFVCCSVVTAELAFYIIFRCVLIPRANRRTEPHPYRDYPPGRRCLLLRRILARIQHTCAATQQRHRYREVVQDFILQWFRSNNVAHPQAALRHQDISDQPRLFLSIPMMEKTTNSSLDSSSLESGSAPDDHDSHSEQSPSTSSDNLMAWSISGLLKDDTDVFFAWAFFGKELHHLTTPERAELESLYPIIRQECEGLYFEATKTADAAVPEATTSSYSPRRLSLEDVGPIHRPLFVYLFIWLFKAVVCDGMLVLMGFERIRSQSGLVAWYRSSRGGPKSAHTMPPTNTRTPTEPLPLLFFHGIAPTGLGFYIPMIIYFIRDGRAAYLFENPPISYCSIGFDALTEAETIRGVQEILDKTGNDNGFLSLVGHSFGSCQLTWLLRSHLQDRIRQFVLLDPVTILLSEPDVMNNFLYCNELSRIRMIASSELFTEHYLRRHFSWYNSELWLDDVPPHIDVLVALSEHDEIINAAKVKQQIEICNRGHRNENHFQVIYWEHVGHADCVRSASKWRSIKQQMLEQELTAAQRK